MSAPTLTQRAQEDPRALWEEARDDLRSGALDQPRILAEDPRDAIGRLLWAAERCLAVAASDSSEVGTYLRRDAAITADAALGRAAELVADGSLVIRWQD
jgi:hypothetical protein